MVLCENCKLCAGIFQFEEDGEITDEEWYAVCEFDGFCCPANDNAPCDIYVPLDADHTKE